jgi:hypothetical protein
MRVYCDVEECLAEAQRGGKCWAHAKQLQRRNATVPVKRLSRRSAMLEAVLAIAYADSENEADFRRAWERLDYHYETFFRLRCRRAGKCPRFG